MTTIDTAAQELTFENGALRYAPDRIELPGVALFDPANPLLKAQPVQVGGRQAAWFVTGGFGSGVLRHYRRGGLVARLSQDRYLWAGAERTRAFAEFNLLYFMHQQGLPVNKPLAAAYWRDGLTYRAAIIVERIPNVHTLAKSLSLPCHAAVAEAIFAMHEAGVWHADLNAYNILLDEQGCAWLIDFDRGRRQVVSLKQRQANLLRLRRSLLKVAGAAGLGFWNNLEKIYNSLLPGGSRA
ncbi:MAG TPA: 3-deoxy-D-manno-octulosonic acid kinase [Eoetvoesiella sp.]